MVTVTLALAPETTVFPIAEEDFVPTGEPQPEARRAAASNVIAPIE
jgi:hypothetical protein